MVKKKSFWLILLAVLTAMVLAFCACGLVGCSGSGSGDSGLSDTLVFQGYTVSDGQTAWTVVTLDESTKTGSMTSYDEKGVADTDNYGELTWDYSDDDKTAISGYMVMVNSSMWSTMQVPLTFALTYVDGKVVAAKYHINYVNMDLDLFEGSVTAALESDGNVGSGHAQLILYDESCTVVMDGTTSYGTWDWTSDKTGISVSLGGSTYNTTAIESYTSYDGVTQITEATFSSFGSASDVTFLHILDEELAVSTLYEFESTEGYTLVVNKDYTFEATVGSYTIYGTTNSTLTTFNDEDLEESYTATTGTDEDGNITLTFESGFFGSVTESVTFVVKGSIKGKEDDANYQTYYNNAEHGTAIAVLTGKAYLASDNTQYEDDEYWLFLYRDGFMYAHVGGENASISMTPSTGIWTWGVADEDEAETLVPSIVRNPNSETPDQTYASDNSDGTWSVRVNSVMTESSYGSMPAYGVGVYWVYTFEYEDYPAGAFEGTTTSSGTVYLVLNGDGTFTAHIGSTYTSDGVWSKDEEGNMKFYKTNSNNNYAISEICTVTENDDGTLSVGITNFMSATNTYIVDPSVVPVGGHTYTDEELAQIAELEPA